MIRRGTVFWISLLAVLNVGCVTEVEWPTASTLPDQVSIAANDQIVAMTRFPPRYSLDPPFGEDRIGPASDEAERAYTIPDDTTLGRYDPFKRYSAQTYYGDDGSVTRHFYVDSGTGPNIAKLLTSQVEGLTLVGDPNNAVQASPNLIKQQENEVIVWKDFLVDQRKVQGVNTPFNKYNHSANQAADLIVIKTKTEKLKEVDSYLACLQNEIPMIEIQVHVSELSVSDSLQYGVSSVIEKITDGDPFLKGWLTNLNTESFRITDPTDFPGALLTLGGKHDSQRADATFEFLQRISDSEIMASPKITVLNGHRAVIFTGDKTPLSKPVYSGDQLAFTYEYKTTGINLVIVPHLLPSGMIQIQVTAEVSSVTGQQTIDFGGGPVQIPIISKRNIGTKLRVQDGRKFVLGGLYSFSDIETISKIPLLGDIPILGYLFRNKSVAKAKSEIFFHIVPRVVRGPGGLLENVEDE